MLDGLMSHLDANLTERYMRISFNELMLMAQNMPGKCFFRLRVFKTFLLSAGPFNGMRPFNLEGMNTTSISLYNYKIELYSYS